MAKGNPANRSLNPDNPSSRKTGVADLDRRRRLTIAVDLWKCVHWFKEGEKFPCLLVFAEPGRIDLLSWKGVEKILEKHPPQKNEGDESQRLDILDHLDIRYQRFEILEDRRATLDRIAFLHLGLPDRSDAIVFVLASFSRMILMSPAYRNQLLANPPEEMWDLP